MPLPDGVEHKTDANAMDPLIHARAEVSRNMSSTDSPAWEDASHQENAPNRGSFIGGMYNRASIHVQSKCLRCLNRLLRCSQDGILG